MKTDAVIAVSTVLLLLGCGKAPESSADENPQAVSGEVQAGAPAKGQQNSVADAGWVVGFSSYGPVPLGVSLKEADDAAPGVIEPLGSTDGCNNTSIAGGRDQVWLMVVDGQLTRVDIYNSDVQTERGAKIGDSEERIQELYPEGVEVQPHKYTDGHYLVVTPRDGGEYRLIFETDGGRVHNYRAGVLPEVAWVEGCA